MCMTIPYSSIYVLLVVLAMILTAVACGEFPAQDCMGTNFIVKGYILNSEKEPIPDAMVRIWSDKSDSEFDVQLKTDSAGFYETDDLFSFGCYPFQIDVSAEGYESASVTRVPDLLIEQGGEITIELEARPE